MALNDIQAVSLSITMGNNKHAIQLLQQVVKIRDARLNEDHPDSIDSATFTCLFLSGQWPDAAGGAAGSNTLSR